MKSPKVNAESRIAALLRLAGLARWTEVFLPGRTRASPSPPLESYDPRAEVGGLESAIARFTEPERNALLRFARESLLSAAMGQEQPELGEVPSRLTEVRACFVTLTKQGKLRGCVGNVTPKEGLAWAVVDNARQAALLDPRFPPVALEEVNAIRIEISVLSEMHALGVGSSGELLSHLHPHLDGVLLRIGARVATFLPQVWEQFTAKADFLDRLSEKAGCPAGAWRDAEALISTYRIESFAETLEPALRN